MVPNISKPPTSIIVHDRHCLIHRAFHGASRTSNQRETDGVHHGILRQQSWLFSPRTMCTYNYIYNYIYSNICSSCFFSTCHAYIRVHENKYDTTLSMISLQFYTLYRSSSPNGAATRLRTNE